MEEGNCEYCERKIKQEYLVESRGKSYSFCGRRCAKAWKKKMGFWTGKKKDTKQTLSSPKRVTRATVVYLILFVLLAFGGYAYYKSFTTRNQYSVSQLPSTHISRATGNEKYSTNPPTSGPHIERHITGQIQSTLIPKELQVHELEHGAVLVQYNCEDCEDIVNKLVAVVRGYKNAKLAPYPEMDSRIALTAWGKMDKFDNYDEERIRRFIELFEGESHGR